MTQSSIQQQIAYSYLQNVKAHTEAVAETIVDDRA